jgi:uncharacterized membrane protein YjjP (DUF1212 family)
MKTPLGPWILGLLYSAVVAALIFAIRFFETHPAMYLVPLAFFAAFAIAIVAIARR